MNLYDAMKECLSTTYTQVENAGDYAIKRDGDTLKIFFEWSDGKKDWMNNFDFPIKPYHHMKNLWFCHRGFLKVWKSIEPYLVAEIGNPEIKKIEIVGYSHGAAIALLCYEYCIFNRPDCDVQGVGFGCPRVFWGFIAKKVKERFKNFKVVRNGRDIVTHVPPALFGFRHISEIVEIGNGESEGMIDDHRPENYLENLK
jgi:hypothetical protein